MKNNYLEIVSLIERLHRLFLESVKCVLEDLKIFDINNTQAMVLYNLGDEQISVGDLTTRGCYLGSNVSYNLKKMAQAGYISHIAAKHDKRSSIVKLSNKGIALRKKLDEAFDQQVEQLAKDSASGLEITIENLKRLGLLWTRLSQKKTGFELD